jgi:hypothetical protein
MIKKSYLAWLATFGLILMSHSQVQADWLTDFDGHSIMGNTGINPEAADGHFSFAVYANDGGNWVDDLLGEMFAGVEDLAGTEVDTDAAYVYFYQIVNSDFFTGGDEHQLDSALVKAVGASVTSVGYLDSTMFQSGPGDNDAGNKVKLPGNPGLGEKDAIADIPGDELFEDHEGTSVGLVMDANAKPFASAVIEADDIEWVFASQLKSEQYSSVFYYTSELGPSITTGMLFGSLAIGDVVSTAATSSAVPAPPALALALLGAPFMSVIRRRRKVAA